MYSLLSTNESEGLFLTNQRSILSCLPGQSRQAKDLLPKEMVRPERFELPTYCSGGDAAREINDLEKFA